MTLQFFLVNKKAKVVGQDSDEEEEEEVLLCSINIYMLYK